MNRAWPYSIAALLVLAPALGSAQAPMIVHEWGTITTRHAPDGVPQGRLNRIDPSEVLPEFVHRYEPEQTRATEQHWFGKGPRVTGRPDITMRLETPVIYFYGNATAAGRAPFDVRVQMRGGILNEFYPRAEVSLMTDPGRVEAKFAARILKPTDPINLDNYLIGALAWNGVKLDPSARVPTTNDAVWAAPRNVSASRVATGGEGEHYLFYRGVAHLDALLGTQHSKTGVRLSAQNLIWLIEERMTIARVWLADVRADGTLAFAMRERLTIAKNTPSAQLAEIARFAASDYSHVRAAALRQSMKSELMAAGLFDDEAEAMLATWNASYFQKPGLRVFYMVPRTWIDYFLQLELSIPHEATRVLVGRIDLVDENRN
jgi:hypothetical protein